MTFEADLLSFHAPLTACPPVAALFSAAAFSARYRAYEIALVEALAVAGLIARQDADALKDIVAGFDPAQAGLADGTVRDGLAVPAYVHALKEACPAHLREHVHRGATSQDLVDTALSQAMTEAAVFAGTEAQRLIGVLRDLEANSAGRTVTGVTRMQWALPMPAAGRVAAWRTGLEAACTRLEKEPALSGLLQFAGAVGTGGSLGDAWPKTAGALAAGLGLTWPGRSWQSDRSDFCAAAAAFSGLTGALGKIGQDVALMALSAPQELSLTGGGSSSAMPHKQNPVDAELLVALHRYNALLAGGMQQSLIHEMERSGAAWTLEWMAIPQIAETTGAALAAATRLLASIQSIGRQA